jgi:glycosyltransferase involved in cell wall biosynthesis
MSITDQNILILNNQGLKESGGGVTMIKALIEHFAVNNQVTLISEGSAEASVVQDKVTQITIQIPAYEHQSFVWRFAPLLRSHFLKQRLSELIKGYDIVFVLDCKYFPAVQAYCRESVKIYLSLSAIPIVAVKDVSGGAVEKFLTFCQYAWLERYAFQHADLSFVSSKTHLAEVRKYEWITKRPFVVYPLIKPKRALSSIETRSPQQLKQALGLEGKIVILTVTRITPLKNLEYLLDLAEQLARDDVVFLIIGDGSHKNRLGEIITQKHLTEKAILYGNQENPGRFYQLADIYIHPSYYESFSCAIHEAMSSGLPVIFPKTIKPYVSAFAELIQGNEALCLDFTDRQVVLDEIVNLIEDRDLRSRIGANARQHAQYFEQASPPYAHQIASIIQYHLEETSP